MFSNFYLEKKFLLQERVGHSRLPPSPLSLRPSLLKVTSLNSYRFIFIKKILKTGTAVIVYYTEGSLLYMINFIIEAYIQDHPNQWAKLNCKIIKDFIILRRLVKVTYLETRDSMTLTICHLA